MENNIVKGGLLPTPEDKNDFLFGSIFGLPKLKELPSEFRLNSLGIKNQGNSTMCAAYGSTTISEIQEGVELSPEYLYAKAKQITGDWRGWGLTIRDICKAITKYGSIEKKKMRHLSYNKL